MVTRCLSGRGQSIYSDGFTGCTRGLCQALRGLPEQRQPLWPRGWSLAHAVFYCSHRAVFCMGCRATSWFSRQLRWRRARIRAARLELSGRAARQPLMPAPAQTGPGGSSGRSPAQPSPPETGAGPALLPSLVTCSQAGKKRKSSQSCSFLHVCSQRCVQLSSGLTKYQYSK